MYFTDDDDEDDDDEEFLDGDLHLWTPRKQ